MGDLRDGIRADQELRLWLVVRADLGMSTGKIVAQAMHAAWGLYRTLVWDRPSLFSRYEGSNHTKIVVKVPSLAALERVEREATALAIPFYSVRDAGRTEIEPGTKTVCLFGPASRSGLPPFLRRLQVMPSVIDEGSGSQLADATQNPNP